MGARQTAGLLAAAVLAIACAACGSSSTSGGAAAGNKDSQTKGPVSTGTSGNPVSPGFPLTVLAANGKVHVASRPTSIVSLSPTVTEMLYAIGAGGQDQAERLPAQPGGHRRR
jgi:iron complex transport system substrate-binding protein